jgi:hypothetical protein
MPFPFLSRAVWHHFGDDMGQELGQGEKKVRKGVGNCPVEKAC